MANNDLTNSVIFNIGTLQDKPKEYLGNIWSYNMVPFTDDVMNLPLGNVTFSPGSRNVYHVHPGGQILLITGGRGYYQEEGGPVRELHAGDVVCVPPNVKHWHGAAPDSWFTHIYIMPNYDPHTMYGKWTYYYEPYEDYDKLK